MKRTLAIIAATAMLTFALAGCGTNRGEGGMPDSGSIAGGTTASDTANDASDEGGMSDTDKAAGASTGAAGGTSAASGAMNRSYGERRMSETGGAGGGTSAASDAISRGYGVGGPNSSVYAASGNSGTPSPSFRGSGAQTADVRWTQMLENARVHDSDGFLLDGENSSYNAF